MSARSGSRLWVAPVAWGLLGLCLCGSGAGAAEKAKIDAAIRRAATWLQSQAGQRKGGYDSLAALALVKSDTGIGQDKVQEIVARVVAKSASGEHKPDNAHSAIYEAGVDLMLLVASDAEQHREVIERIAAFLLANQSPRGEWDYLGTSNRNGGDTSITSYAMLGLWAARRAGVEIDEEAWDRCARWHLGTQTPQGGFIYHPTFGRRPNGGSGHGTTTSGLASQLIAMRHLYPGEVERAARRAKARERKKTGGKRFGVLERIDLDSGEVNSAGQGKSGSYNPETPRQALETSIRGGLDWLAANWQVGGVTNHRGYYLYGLERVAALADLRTFGDHDWYSEGADFLLEQQASNGSWEGGTSPAVTTSFCMLFLSRATAKTLNRAPAGTPVGGGLLAGGRGLPDDLNAVQVEQGQVQARKMQGPLDELLAELEKSEGGKVSAAQAAIVQQVQLADREALISQQDRLRELILDRRVDVRRTAVWALGRTADLGVTRLLLGALRDPDLSVVVEARSALCALSRLTGGQGLPAQPLAGLPEDATAEEREQAVAAWRKEVVVRWERWYLKTRPWAERDDLFELQRRAAARKNR